ncbi:M12 family metallopeptidase, partial [Priestia aryabhattai]|uniref:M12 family metallopeptidase n=1 Tax=Priestia aryabhattai TaxID=412384 RepID=UPI001C8D1086
MNKEPRICTELTLTNLTENGDYNLFNIPEYSEIVSPNGKRWKVGQTLKVRFLDGEKSIQDKVQKFAKEWEKYADIHFDFGEHEDAVIRISFKEKGSWSYIGTDCLGIDKNKATMNYGWFDTNTSDTEYSRTVLHEFGHALGFAHEHQSPVGSIPWDKEKVYEYYAQPPNNWDREKVNQNIFEKYSITNSNFSEFDVKSIMLYAIPKDLTEGGFETDWNTELSETDKKYASQVFYPKSYTKIGLKTQNGHF